MEFAKNNILKKSIILTKLWAKHEGKIVNTRAKLLSSYSIEVMTIYILRKFYAYLQTPMDVSFSF